MNKCELSIIMNTIKINFTNFWNGFNKNVNLFTKLLSPHFNIEISEKPDFLICSNLDVPFEYIKYDCVRLMFMGENISPDFSLFDYVIGFDFLEFDDRYFRLPLAFYTSTDPYIPEKLTIKQAQQILEKKKYFCNFIYSHPTINGIREEIFQRLCKYKYICSPGSYLNNINSDKNNKISKRCSFSEKIQYLELSKFTISGESIEYPGFVTEKIIHPFQYHSVPIYFGNPRVDEDFNPRAFVWCHSHDDISRVLKEVEYLDTHDDAYIDMLLQCPLHSPQFILQRIQQLENYLVNIFSQSPEKAYRRVRHYKAKEYEQRLLRYYELYKKLPPFIRDKIL